MIQKIKSYLLVAAMGLALGVPGLIPATAGAADCTNIASKVSKGANTAAGEGTTGNCANDTGVNDEGIGALGARVVNLFSLIVGIIAIIMIIYGGFRYITSGGDSGRVGAAKNSLIYAIVGLIIVAFAQLIVLLA